VFGGCYGAWGAGVKEEKGDGRHSKLTHLHTTHHNPAHHTPQISLPHLHTTSHHKPRHTYSPPHLHTTQAFKTDINSLPLSLDLSWFEQKAVAVLLTLLHLGVRNIRLGPRLPAFLTADAVAVMVDKFGLIPADQAHPEEEVKAMIAKH